MSRKAIFEGLVVDENDRPVEVVYVGDEPNYVVNDAGFRRHIQAEQVDMQVLDSIREMIEGHENIISEQTAKMLGQDDIFSRAMIENQLRNIDKQYDNLFEVGIPEEARAYMGMVGLRIKINLHGEVVDIIQPGATGTDEEE